MALFQLSSKHNTTFSYLVEKTDNCVPPTALPERSTVFTASRQKQQIMESCNASTLQLKAPNQLITGFKRPVNCVGHNTHTTMLTVPSAYQHYTHTIMLTVPSVYQHYTHTTMLTVPSVRYPHCTHNTMLFLHYDIHATPTPPC